MKTIKRILETLCFIMGGLFLAGVVLITVVFYCSLAIAMFNQMLQGGMTGIIAGCVLFLLFYVGISVLLKQHKD